jgi:tetratricopeptide (TPR) repeat protein
MAVPRGSARVGLGWVAAVLLAVLAGAGPAGAEGPPVTAGLDLAVAQAQASLQKGDLAAAQDHYRQALFEGWMTIAALQRLAARPAEAVAATLDEARASLAAGDSQAAFLLGAEYLWLKQLPPAETLFAQALADRPVPALHVLIGRAYRDAGEYGPARVHLGQALSQDPAVRRAHYYLGMIALADASGGPERLDAAIAEFRAELALDPADALANDQLGVTLLDAGRPAEALPALEAAARTDPRFLHLSHLGRGLLAVDRAADAVPVLRRALDLAAKQDASAGDLRKIHYQLGLALRKLGQSQEAAKQFEESRAASADDGAEGTAAATAGAGNASGAASPLAAVTPAAREKIEAHVKTELARAYLNLGVIEAQGERFAEAAARFEKAAALDPEFPQVQSSLGIAYFNARQFDKAAPALARAVAANPGPSGLSRMLAMAWLNTDDYARAADLLRDDPEREKDPALQFAYGMALVKSDRAAEAEQVFDGLVRAHGDSAELSVFLGQAYAQQGQFDAALASLDRARKLKPDVAEASSTMGVIYLRQGRLREAEQALRAELAAHPSDLRAQQDLAAVLDLQQRGEEALALLRAVVQARPKQAGAQYLLGKILLAQGAATEALPHLEAAVQDVPGDAPAHYQLGRAYQALGQGPRAEQEFERFRQLKAAR